MRSVAIYKMSLRNRYCMYWVRMGHIPSACYVQDVAGEAGGITEGSEPQHILPRRDSLILSCSQRLSIAFVSIFLPLSDISITHIPHMPFCFFKNRYNYASIFGSKGKLVKPLYEMLEISALT